MVVATHCCHLREFDSKEWETYIKHPRQYFTSKLMISKMPASKGKSFLAAVECWLIISSRKYWPLIGLQMSLSKTPSHKWGHIIILCILHLKTRQYKDTCLILGVIDQLSKFLKHNFLVWGWERETQIDWLY